jgi:hypothetical protein
MPAELWSSQCGASGAGHSAQTRQALLASLDLPARLADMERLEGGIDEARARALSAPLLSLAGSGADEACGAEAGTASRAAALVTAVLLQPEPEREPEMGTTVSPGPSPCPGPGPSPVAALAALLAFDSAALCHNDLLSGKIAGCFI